MSHETEAVPRLADASEDMSKPKRKRARDGGSRVDEAYRKILAIITEGALVGGQRLPSEGEMAATIGVSRPVIRQALTRLQHSGVVKVRWGAGTYVQDASGATAAGASPSFGPVRSLNEVRQVYDFRAALEGEAAALAARNPGAPAIAMARRALETLETVLATSVEAQEADLEFHLAIATASGNPFYERAMRSIQRSIDFSIGLTRTLSLTHPRDRLLTVQAEHVAVLKAIEAGEPEKARAAMRTHLENACRRLFQGPGD
jgi:GntR family transcriptional repressor for pyruvate dehydrogenase complex